MQSLGAVAHPTDFLQASALAFAHVSCTSRLTQGFVDAARGEMRLRRAQAAHLTTVEWSRISHAPLHRAINYCRRFAAAERSARRANQAQAFVLHVGNNEATMATLTRLKDMGESIVMDDFGTDYSSLSYLTRCRTFFSARRCPLPKPATISRVSARPPPPAIRAPANRVSSNKRANRASLQ